MWKTIQGLWPIGENRHNMYASMAVLTAVLFFQLNTDPEACGSDPVSSVRSAPRFFLPQVIPAILARSGQSADANLEEILANQPPAIANPVAEPVAPQLPGSEPLTGRWALESSLALLEQGRERLQKLSGYSVTFARQERIGGELLDPQTMKLKVRHHPFSLYMKWTQGDRGRQLIYVEGLNEGQVLVQPGGLIGRATGALPLAPNHEKILAESRYPATMAGFLAMTDIIMEHHREDLKRASGMRSEIRGDQSFDERPCFLTTLTYDNEQVNPVYRKSLIFVDKELSIPVCLKSYTWVKGKELPVDDEESLIESYSFTGLETTTQLSDNDFEKSQYKMR